MKTKEEILKKHGCTFVQGTDGKHWLEAMDTYAEQVAMEFIEWFELQDKYQSGLDDAGKVTFHEIIFDKDGTAQFSDAIYTSELYELFIKTK